MKNKLLVVLVALLLGIMPAAHAGFVVKKASLAGTQASTAAVASAKEGYVAMRSTVRNTKIATTQKVTGFIAKLNEHLSFLHPYKLHKENEWFGMAALGCGLLGLLVPGMNLAAILFGVLGMGRGCKVHGLAVAGFVMGILELVLFLILDTVFVSLILL